MILETIAVGPNQSNCYILGCSATKEAVIIDPGAEASQIKKLISRSGAKPECIINTHGHADHIGANKDFGLPVFIHKLDADFLTSPRKNLSMFFGFWITSPPAGRLLSDGDTVNVGELILEVVHTPGHTPGSICIKVYPTPAFKSGACPVVFTGDTLFADGVGRTDFAYSSEKDLFDSIKNKLLVLDDDVVIYPGHGPPSTIGREKKTNPFLMPHG